VNLCPSVSTGRAGVLTLIWANLLCLDFAMFDLRFGPKLRVAAPFVLYLGHIVQLPLPVPWAVRSWNWAEKQAFNLKSDMIERRSVLL
jgi:hypothetical protein